MKLIRIPSEFATITLRASRDGSLIYQQQGGNQTTVDRNGVSVDVYVHALYGLMAQTDAHSVLMIGCGGGSLATMLARARHAVTIVDIDLASFRVARRYFGLPHQIECRVGDGLAFMRRTRRRFDALIVDAFVGEDIPDHMQGASLVAAARRCVGKAGIVLVNVCLGSRTDRTADKFAQAFHDDGWSVRLLDEPSAERNAIVMAGTVSRLRLPRMLEPPEIDPKRAKRRLKAMRFRRRLAL